MLLVVVVLEELVGDEVELGLEVDVVVIEEEEVVEEAGVVEKEVVEGMVEVVEGVSHPF
jgi:hypothetical protein